MSREPFLGTAPKVEASLDASQNHSAWFIENQPNKQTSREYAFRLRQFPATRPHSTITGILGEWHVRSVRD